MRIGLVLVALAALASQAAAAERCPAKPRGGRTTCLPTERTFEPYDPDRLKGGSRPGFIDLGGTEVRVGGRARYEYGYQR